MQFSKLKMFVGFESPPKWIKDGKSFLDKWSYLHPAVGDGEELNKKIVKNAGKLNKFMENRGK